MQSQIQHDTFTYTYIFQISAYTCLVYPRTALHALFLFIFVLYNICFTFVASACRCLSLSLPLPLPLSLPSAAWTAEQPQLSTLAPICSSFFSLLLLFIVPFGFWHSSGSLRPRRFMYFTRTSIYTCILRAMRRGLPCTLARGSQWTAAATATGGRLSAWGMPHGLSARAAAESFVASDADSNASWGRCGIFGLLPVCLHAS